MYRHWVSWTLPVSSMTTVIVPYTLTERVFGILNCSCPFSDTQNKPTTSVLPLLWGFPTSELIWAGMLTNSGLEANAVKFSTASIKGAVAIRHLLRLSSEKSPSRAWWEKTQRSLLGCSNHHPAKRWWFNGNTENVWWVHKQWIRTDWRDLCHQAEGLSEQW